MKKNKILTRIEERLLKHFKQAEEYEEASAVLNALCDVGKLLKQN